MEERDRREGRRRGGHRRIAAAYDESDGGLDCCSTQAAQRCVTCTPHAPAELLTLHWHLTDRLQRTRRARTTSCVRWASASVSWPASAWRRLLPEERRSMQPLPLRTCGATLRCVAVTAAAAVLALSSYACSYNSRCVCRAFARLYRPLLYPCLPLRSCLSVAARAGARALQPGVLPGAAAGVGGARAHQVRDQAPLRECAQLCGCMLLHQPCSPPSSACAHLAGCSQLHSSQ